MVFFPAFKIFFFKILSKIWYEINGELEKLASQSLNNQNAEDGLETKNLEALKMKDVKDLILGELSDDFKAQNATLMSDLQGIGVQDKDQIDGLVQQLDKKIGVIKHQFHQDLYNIDAENITWNIPAEIQNLKYPTMLAVELVQGRIKDFFQQAAEYVKGGTAL